MNRMVLIVFTTETYTEFLKRVTVSTIKMVRKQHLVIRIYKIVISIVKLSVFSQRF